LCIRCKQPPTIFPKAILSSGFLITRELNGVMSEDCTRAHVKRIKPEWSLDEPIQWVLKDLSEVLYRRPNLMQLSMLHEVVDDSPGHA